MVLKYILFIIAALIFLPYVSYGIRCYVCVDETCPHREQWAVQNCEVEETQCYEMLNSYDKVYQLGCLSADQCTLQKGFANGTKCSSCAADECNYVKDPLAPDENHGHGLIVRDQSSYLSIYTSLFVATVCTLFMLF
ncbi:unnamed protein product [Enterobius vermicularis]|uniref:UPAR/Ly6 domain-containing protein n=1 Tax=Enterobius vermicularis TaxID=51028 RepID=A0A0N4V1D2_ENTVE|nr:unnamed protein product [Enterobius vermicularis]